MLAVACGSYAGAPSDPGPKVSLWLTTGDGASLLQRQADLTFTDGDRPAPITIEVDEAAAGQEIDGFGASLTESAAWVLTNGLSEGARELVLTRLFSAEDGIGLSLLRQPMGASDFALTNYTYDDRPAATLDPELRGFSIDHDRATILPLLRRAKAINPRLRLMATPWSPPAWMKTTRSLFGGKLREAYYASYATLFVRYLQAYAAEGLPVDFVTVQNEPHNEPETYPGMRMEAEEQAAFIRDHLGPAFRANGIGTRILAWDHNWNEPDYALAVLGDPGARSFVAGSAFHCYAGDVAQQLDVHRAYPDRGIWFTECSGGDFAPSFADNLKWNVSHLMIGATRNWARSVLLWNIALDENRGPQNGGCGNCRGVVTVNIARGAVQYEVEYYALGHLSAFVVPGARRIDSTTLPGRIETVAFRNPDGSKVLLGLNAGAGSSTFTVRWSGRSFEHTLGAGSVVTFRWP